MRPVGELGLVVRPFQRSTTSLNAVWLRYADDWLLGFAGPKHEAEQSLQVRIDRDEGRKPLIARFGGIPLIRQRAAVLTDRSPVLASSRRNELIHRLLAESCELCQTRTDLEVHHIRKLADLNRPGRPEPPSWKHLMAMRRRKTLVICRSCHEDIHAGRPTAFARR